MISMLKLEDLEDMAANGPFPIEIRCHYCNTVYSFSQEEMTGIKNLRRADN
jgi:molecular chaperone Hsp33